MAKKAMYLPTTLDLFAGAGGLSLGFAAAGFRCLGAVDRDERSMETFAGIFAHDNPMIFAGAEGDIGAVGVDAIAEAVRKVRGSPDVIIGGPPCQGFSRIGRAKYRSLRPEDEVDPNLDQKNNLYRFFLEAVERLRPAAFVMENVPGMLRLGGVDHVERIVQEARRLRYNVRCFMLNAADYGVPQARWRLFFVGLKRDLGISVVPEPPLRTHDSGIPDLEGLEDPEHEFFIPNRRVPMVTHPEAAVTVRDAIGDLPRFTAHLTGGPVPSPDDELPSVARLSPYVEMLRAWPGCPSDANLTDHWYRVTMPERDQPLFRAMPPGGRFPDVIDIANRRFVAALAALGSDAPTPGSPDYDRLRDRCVPPYRQDAFEDKWRKLDMSAPAWTVTAHLAKDGYSHIHYDGRQARTVTIREAARLQSFPDGVRFRGAATERFRQIGNAVPPVLARAVAAKLREQLEELGALATEKAA